MKIFPISTLNISELKPKQSVFSKYAQNYLTSDLNTLLYNFDRVFDRLIPEQIAAKISTLSKLGIINIGENKTKGIILEGDKYNYHILSPKESFLQINLINKENNQVQQEFSFEKNSDKYKHAGIFSSKELEEFLSDVIDHIDSKIIVLSRNLLQSSNIEKAYIPNTKTKQALGQLNKTLPITNKKEAFENAGRIDATEQEMITTLIEEYFNLKELFTKIPNNASRFNVRSYFKNYDTTTSTTTKMAFKDIGPMGEPLSVTYLSHNNKTYIAVTVTDINNNELQYVISEDGTVQKNRPYIRATYGNSSKNINTKPDYYTQEEINNSKIGNYLVCLIRELKSFEKHTKNWLQEQEDFKKAHSNENIASLKKYNAVIDDIAQNFNKYKLGIMKIIHKFDQRRNFKIKNNISTEMLTNSVLFKHITPEGHDLRLSFPKVHDKTATQILVMNGEKIVKSFYILDNKLLKFNIKKKTDKFVHFNRKMYFYDNKYVEQSNIETYLTLLQNKLKDLNTQLDTIAKSKGKRKKT